MMAALLAAMSLGELLGPAAGPASATMINDLVSDSRQVRPGAAFVALAGNRNHGLEFADAALEAGASVILFEPPAPVDRLGEKAVAVPGLAAELGTLARRYYGRARLPDGLTGVTGTNGKTTTAWLISEALTQLGENCAYIGTLGYGSPGDLKPQRLTTPDCLTLHRELAELASSTAALEVSSHALSQNRIAGLGFDVAVFTNLSQDHLDWHGTIDDYFETKAKLFDRDDLSAAVVNAADSFGLQLLGRLRPGIRPVAAAVDADGDFDLNARFAGRGLDGMVLEVEGRFGRTTIESRLIGAFNAENLLLAFAATLARGHSPDDAGRALSQAGAPPGRMEVFGGPPGRPWVIVDYAHTPAAMSRVLDAIASLNPRSLSVVFGCGGNRDRGKRALMGTAAAARAGHIVLTDDNPRDEDPSAIVADIRAGIGAGHSVQIEHARERAITGAIESARPGDVVVIAGKGHETQQQTGDSYRELSDREIVRDVLEGLS